MTASPTNSRFRFRKVLNFSFVTNFQQIASKRDDASFTVAGSSIYWWHATNLVNQFYVVLASSSSWRGASTTAPQSLSIVIVLFGQSLAFLLCSNWLRCIWNLLLRKRSESVFLYIFNIICFFNTCRSTHLTVVSIIFWLIYWIQVKSFRTSLLRFFFF